MASQKTFDYVFETTNPNKSYDFKWTIEHYSEIKRGTKIRSPELILIDDTIWYATLEKSSDENKRDVIIIRLHNSTVLKFDISLYAIGRNINGVVFQESSGILQNRNDSVAEFKCDMFKLMDCYGRCLNYSLYGFPHDIFVLECRLKFSNHNIQTKDLKTAPQVSHTPVPTPNVLCKQLKKFYDNSTHTDATLNVQGCKIFAHKLILSAQSEVFLKMFQADMQENITNEIQITDIQPDVFKLLLEYMYSCECPALVFDAAQALYCAADKYCILQLKQLIVDFLLSEMSDDNAVDLLFFAHAYEEKVLQDKAVSYIKSNKDKTQVLENITNYTDEKYKAHLVEVLKLLI